MPACKSCGSKRHEDNDCPILQKVRLAQMGVPIEHLFDRIVEISSLDNLAQVVKEIHDETKH